MKKGALSKKIKKQKVNYSKVKVVKNNIKKEVNLKVLILSFVIVSIVAFIGGSITVIDDWYYSVKPVITPPNFVFPVVWSILYFMMGLSMYFAWTNSREKRDKINVGLLFSINYLLNPFWSFLFFVMKRPQYAFYCIIALWLSILAMIIYFWKIDKKASWLLVPYLIWVSFAGLLNWLIGFS